METNTQSEKNIKLVAEFLKTADFRNYEFDTKHVLTDDIFFIRKKNFNKPVNHLYEDHKKMIDIHFCEVGGEEIRVTYSSELALHTPYDEETDMTWYKGSGKHKFKKVILKQGEFLVLHPTECHEPEIAVSEENIKILFKIKVKYEKNYAIR